MPEFIRARSSEQKSKRLEEIKAAADSLYTEHPYHEITLTTIATKLNWTRSNLYKYVTTKEEIFLEVARDKKAAYYDAMKAAFPVGTHYSITVFAELWAGIINAHQNCLLYDALLQSIIETNVPVEKLATFKKFYFENFEEVTRLISENLGISIENAQKLFNYVQYEAVGLYTNCKENPLVESALEMIGKDKQDLEPGEDLKDFILILLEHYCKQTPK